MKNKSKGALYFALLMTLTSTFPPLLQNTFAQNNSGAANKVVRAVQVADAPVIDGILDEDIWALAEPITDFHQTRPGDGTATSGPPEERIISPRNGIYIPARMNDSNPELIPPPTLRHGQGLGPDDRLL